MKKSFSQRLISTGNSFALLPLRLAVGTVMIAHGAQKLFGWFDGGGLEGTAEYMSSIGFNPGGFFAFAAGAGEFLGGILLFLGLLSRIGGLLTAAVMGVAVFAVHREAFFVGKGGMEFALVLLTAGIAFLIAGGGALSIDRMLAKKSPKKAE